MSNFNLTHTGQQVDDAITKVRNGITNTFDTVDALITHLQGLSSFPTTGTAYKTFGRTTKYDSPEAIWRTNSASHTDNSGTIRTVSSNDHIEMQQWDGHVSHFGAVGDGVADDTTAINNAIEVAAGAVTGLPRNVIIGDGTFKITAKIELRDAVHIMGQGVDKTELQWGGADGGTMVGRTGSGKISQLSFERLTLNGLQDATNAGPSGTGPDIGLDCTGIQSSKFTQLNIKKLRGGGTNVLLSSTSGSDLCLFNTFEQIQTFQSHTPTSGATPNITAPTDHAIAGAATVSAGAITAIAITDGGSGYTAGEPPYVNIVGKGTGATATATIDGSGVVTGVTINTGGSGYDAASTIVTFSRANFMRPSFAKYSFRIQKNSNANTFINCKTQYAIYGFSFEGNPTDLDDNVANQNTLIGCSSEPSWAGIHFASDNNTVTGHRLEGNDIPILFAKNAYYGANPKLNSIVHPTFYSKRTGLDDIVGLTEAERFTQRNSILRIPVFPADSNIPANVVADADIRCNSFLQLPNGTEANKPALGSSDGWDDSSNNSAFKGGMAYFAHDEGRMQIHGGTDWLDLDGHKVSEIYKRAISIFSNSGLNVESDRYKYWFIEQRDDGSGAFVGEVNVNHDQVYFGKKMHFRIVQEASTNCSLVIKDSTLATPTVNIASGSNTVTVSSSAVVVGEWLKIPGAGSGGSDFYARIVKRNNALTYQLDANASTTVFSAAAVRIAYYLNSANYEDKCVELVYAPNGEGTITDQWVLWKAATNS